MVMRPVLPRDRQRTHPCRWCRSWSRANPRHRYRRPTSGHRTIRSTSGAGVRTGRCRGVFRSMCGAWLPCPQYIHLSGLVYIPLADQFVSACSDASVVSVECRAFATVGLARVRDHVRVRPDRVSAPRAEAGLHWNTVQYRSQTPQAKTPPQIAPTIRAVRMAVRVSLSIIPTRYQGMHVFVRCAPRGNRLRCDGTLASR